MDFEITDTFLLLEHTYYMYNVEGLSKKPRLSVTDVPGTKTTHPFSLSI